MLNFAEQTGSGAVIVVWSFLLQATSTENTHPTSTFQTTNNKQRPKNIVKQQTTQQRNNTTQQCMMHAHATGNRRQQIVDCRFHFHFSCVVLCCVVFHVVLLCFLTATARQQGTENRNNQNTIHPSSTRHSTLDNRIGNWKLEIGTWKKKNPYSSCIVHRASCSPWFVVRHTSHVTYHTSWSPRRQLVNSSSAFVSLHLAWLGVFTCLDSSSFLIAFKSGIATAVIFKTAKRHSRCLGITKAKNSTWMMWIALLFVVAVPLVVCCLLSFFYVSCLVPRSCLVWSFWILRAKKTSRANYTRHSARSTPMVVS